jgi:hypothetical protein
MKRLLPTVILVVSGSAALAGDMKLHFSFDGERFITVENASITTWKKCVAHTANSDGSMNGYKLDVGLITAKQILKWDLHEFANKNGERYDIFKLKFQGLWVDCRLSGGGFVNDGFRWE